MKGLFLLHLLYRCLAALLLHPAWTKSFGGKDKSLTGAFRLSAWLGLVDESSSRLWGPLDRMLLKPTCQAAFESLTTLHIGRYA